MMNNYGSSPTRKATLKSLWVVMMVLLFGYSARAQVSSYIFSTSSGTYTPITGGTVLGVPSNDDTSFPNNPLGFSFCYNGTTYTAVGINSNGWLEMGGQTVMNNSYTAISSGIDNNVVAALNYDIQGDATVGELRYQTIGTAPNRTFVVQWSNYDSYQSALNGDVYNFQIRLSETTNQIDIVYGSFTKDATIRTAQVGLRGASTADYNNVSISNGLQTWATPISGTFNSATSELNNALFPVSGQTFTWTQPAAPAVPITPSFTAVTATGMTLNWVDNSTNEATFVVQRSTDNVTFTTVSTITSTSIATTGTPYSYVATNLYNATLYYWRVFATNANCGNSFLAAQQSTLSGSMCGTYTVGPTGAYTSLTAAFAAVAANGVSCPLVFDLQAAYVSTVETFPISIPFLGNGPSSTITVRPELAATNLSITSNATQTIIFNGAQYITFDGRPGSTGTTRHLTIENTSTTGMAVQFINDAYTDGLNYITVRGVNTSTTQGVVTFSGAVASGIGNSNNSITNCELRDGATTPTNLIYGLNGTANVFNSNNTISNNIIHDWFSATAVNAAINLSTGNTAWTISNNSFYQTATRTFTVGNTNFMVNLAPGSGTNTGAFVVSGNYFGGTAALCGGTAYTTAGTVAHRFIALQCNTGTGGTNSIQGNIFRNFNHTTTSGATTANGIWCAINTIGTNGANNIGTVTPNVIGSNTANNQIVTSCTTTGGLTVGYNNSASGAQNFSNNIIGGITANSSGVTISSSVVGIQTSSGTSTVISGNTVGSVSMTSSIINAASTGATGGQVSGIVCSAFNSSLPGNQITNNTIYNLVNQYAGTSTTGYTRGIVASSGINTITGNTLMNLSNLAPQTGTTTSASVQGITLSSTTSGANQTVANNSITNIANGSTTGNLSIIGIYATGSTLNQALVYNNNILGIGGISAGSAVVNGIQIAGGICRVYNNFVNIGIDALGNALTTSHEYNGIYKTTGNRATVMFNTVNVSGSGVNAGVNNTFAFRRTASPTTNDSLYSNIFVNNRSNGASTGLHFAISLNNNSFIVGDRNVYYGTGTGFVFGSVNATNYTSLPNWQVASLIDANSFNVNPNFLSATNLHINNASQSVLESRAQNMNLIFDIDNQVRPGPTAVNGGGTGPDIGADEFDGIPVNVDYGVQLLVNPTTTGCHTATETVRVRIKNYATATVNMAVNPVTITGSVTGPNPATFGPLVITSGTIPAGGTIDTAIATNYNMTAVGTYVFNAVTSAASDFINSNDAMAAVSISISGGTVTVLPNPNCEGSATTLTVSGQTSGGAFQWQSSPDNVTWTNIVGATTSPYTTNPNDTTFYRIVSCGLHNSTVDTVNTIHVAPATTTNDTICGPGTVNLLAAGSGPLNWYDSLTGGTLLNTGTTFSPSITATTTYYVENTFTSGAAGAPATATCMPVYSFACTSSDFINNVYTTGATTNISNLASGCNGVAPNNTTFFPSQIVTTSPGSSFNFFCQAGSSFGQGFRIWIDYNNDGDFADAGENVLSFASSTLLNSGVITVPSTTAPGPKRMRVMCRYATVPTATDYCLATASFGEVEEYTVMVSLLCSSTRTPVTGVVTPPPAMTVTAGNASLCGSDSTQIIAASSNAGYAYTWSPATYLNTTTNDSVWFAPASPGNYSYVVTAFDAVSGCTNIDTISLGSSLRPTFTLAASDDSVCAGSPTELSVVLPSSVVQITNSNVLNTTTTYPAPYGNWYGGARHQMLVLASEMTAAGLTAGYIGGLQFQITNIGTSAPLQNFTIEMMPTSVTSITTWEVGPFQTVLMDPLYTPFVGNNVHNFSTPFYWDGVSNVIVQTCFNNLTFTQNCVFRQTTTAFSSTVYYRNDNEPGVCSNTLVTGSNFQRPNIAFLRSSASLTYSWTPVATVASPTNDTTIATPTVSTNYVMTVTDTLSGCFTTDTIFIFVKPTPAPNFGADTVICSNQPLLLDATSGPYTYLWQDSTVAQTYNVNLFGIYDVLVTDTTNGCTGTDTILIGVNAAPAFSLGSDVTVCAGTQVTFSGPGGQYDYLWNTSDTTITITTGTAGSYDLVVTDTISGCYESDTIALNVNPLPVVALGADSTLCSVNAPVVLTAPAGNYTYLWSDMSTNDSLTVNATGSYYVTVTDTMTTCFSGDTIVVTINSSPVVSLGADSTQCGGSILVTAPAGPFDYLWQDNSTNATYTSTSTETVTVLVTDSVTGCATADTVNLTINAVPVVNLGADTSVCGGSVTLDAGVTTNGAYLWNDMSNGQTLTASTTGQYYVSVTDSLTGCNSSDSVNVTINTPPTVTFSIAQDTMCTTDPAITLSGSPAGGTFSGPGVTGNSFNAATAGVGSHSITYDYTDANGCQASVSDVIIVSACVGMDEPFIGAGMNVFPNPNNGLFTLTINDANYSEMSVEIATVDGKVVYSDMASNVQGSYVKTLDLTTHANGIYFLRVTANGQTFVQKIVKND